MIHHIKHATRHLIFWSLLALAISLTGVRVLLSSIDNYQADLATRIGELVGAPVTLGHLGAKMRGFSPELVLKDITVASVVADAPPAVQLKEIRLGINLLDMLIRRDLWSSSRVTLVGTKLSVTRKADGSFAIVGLKAGDEQPVWLLQGGKYEVLQSEISWQDQKSPAKPLKFESVDLAIINDAQQHKINAIIKLPEKFGETLTVAMDLQGNAFEPSAINGAVYIEGQNIKLAELAAVDLPFALSIGSGIGNFKIWNELQHSQLVAMTAEIQLQQLKILRPDKDVFPVNQLTTGLHWRLNDHQWRLDVAHFLLETSETGGVKKWPDAVVSIAGFVNDGNFLHNIAASIPQLDLQEVSRIAQFFAPLSTEQANLLAQAQVKGALEEFTLYADPDEKTLAVNGRFIGLSVSPFAQVPGISNLSGQIRGDEKAGVLRLATENAQIIAPIFFREPFLINGLNGNINWLQTDADWTVSSANIKLALQKFQSKSRLSLTLPKTDDQPFLDLQTSFVSDDISEIKHYLPAKVMKPADVVWYDQAFLSGRVTQGDLLYVGKLGAFPTKAQDGVFEAIFDIDKLNLAYLPDWPQITDLAGKVVVLQNVMNCDIHQGHSSNLNITQATVTNPALGKSKLLMVKGELEGTITDTFTFLKQSPLASTVGFLVDAVVPQGNTQVSLDLTLPLAEGILPKVYGSAQFNQARLNVTALDLWINKIDGDLKFTEQGVYSDGIKAVALGRPIKVNINKTDHQQIFLNIKGSAGIADLQQQFKMPGWELAQGAMDYQLKLGLPFPGSPSELVVQSDMVGVALELPGFLAKTAIQKKPLSLTFGLGNEAFLPIAIDYNDTFKAAVKLDLAQQRLHSGHILVGSGVVVQPSEPGLTLEINQDPLNLQDWLGLSANQNNTSDAGNNIREIKIHSPHAQWKNTPLGAFDLTLKPGDHDWSGLIDSDIATGKMRIPLDFKGAEKITLDMSSIDLSALKQLESQSDVALATVATKPKPELAPAAMPLLSIASNATLWQSVNLGQLTLETERISNGIAIKQLELTGKEQQLKVSGDWKVSGLHSETRLQGRLEAPRAGKLLSQLGITKELMETSAVVDFTGAWQAAPYQFSLAALQGKLDVNLKNGRILSIEPGFGRVLGVLAMAQWVKRLQLDFSDVYQEGLTFNTIKGHFDLLNGKAATHDLVVDAIPAKITITGETDYVNRTLDQIASVVPKSADAVPIAGTIMGKIAGLIGQSLTGKSQEGFFFGSQYLVKGGWGNVQVIPLHENEGLLQKTWTGISGFPWLQQPKNQ